MCKFSISPRFENLWYGEGSTVIPIIDEFAEYALNLVATNIVLLVGTYKRGKTIIREENRT